MPYSTQFEDTHVITHFLPNTIKYTESTILLKSKKEPHIESLASRISCIHHKNHIIEIPNFQAKMLQIATKLQILVPYINLPQSTLVNIVIKKYTNWNKLTHLQMLNQNILIFPLLPDYTHIRPLKYLPQYGYYTNGSFKTPKEIRPRHE